MYALMRWKSISQRFGEWSEARILVERLNDVYELTPEHPRSEAMRMPPTLRGYVRFVRVCYPYSCGGKKVQQNLEPELPPGQTVARVGRSGSGKRRSSACC